MSEKKAVPAEDLDWIRIRTKQSLEYDDDESTIQKAIRKSTENPLVPIGVAATTCALLYGVYNFYQGKRLNQQYAMRARVGFQLFTIVAVGCAMLKSGATSTIGKQTKKNKSDSTEMKNELLPQSNSTS